MISYEPLWQTLKKKGISTYDLVEHYKMSRGMLSNLKHNRSITIASLNKLCEMFECDITDILRYTPENKAESTENEDSTMNE